MALRSVEVYPSYLLPNSPFSLARSEPFWIQDRTAKIWKLPELTLANTLRGHKRGIWSVDFSPIDQCVLTSSGDLTLRVWALKDGSCLKSFEGHTGSVLRASFISKGTQIISSGGGG